MTGGSSNPEMCALAAGGNIAAGVAQELVRPLRELREVLAVVVEHLDKHVSEASGPTPLPWDETRLLREKLATAYLSSRHVSRLTAELAEALGRSDSAHEVADLNKLVETAINLARSRISAGTELFIDLGTLPAVKVPTGPTVLVVADLITIAADSARPQTDAAISIKTRRVVTDGEPDMVSIYVADNGVGQPDRVASTLAVARGLAVPLGGSFSGTSEQGTGSVFDLRLPLNPSSKR